MNQISPCTLFLELRCNGTDYTRVMHYIYKLRSHRYIPSLGPSGPFYELTPLSSDLARKALIDFLLQRLGRIKYENVWVERALITVLWLYTFEAASQWGANELLNILNDLQAIWTRSLTAEATHGALIVSTLLVTVSLECLTPLQLLWKRIDRAYVGQAWEDAVAWCRLAQHSLFDKSGDTNKAKIHREASLVQLH